MGRRRRSIGKGLCFMSIVRSLVVRAAASVLAFTLATPAAAQCWQEDTVKAAQVRELQTWLMVGALQCRSSGHDVLSHYNQFVRTHRTLISKHNDQLKAHFAPAGKRAYDQFTTALANSRANQSASASFCADTARLAAQVAAAPQHQVEALAETLIARPQHVGRQCT